ncbi:MAG: response regulator [Bacteroidetes bacterium]|nr:response regulator [Bacteroidota bacterium]
MGFSFYLILIHVLLFLVIFAGWILIKTQTRKKVRDVFMALASGEYDKFIRLSAKYNLFIGDAEKNIFLNSVFEKEKRFRDFIDTFPEIVFDIDGTGNILYANDKAYQVFEYSKEGLAKGINIFSMIAPEYLQLVKSNFTKLFSKQKPEQGDEYKLVTRTGKNFYAEIYIKPIFSEGNVTNLRGVIIDVTNKRKNNEIVRVYSDILQTMQLGFMIFEKIENENESGIVLINCNNAAKEILNLKKTKVEQKRIEDILPFYDNQGMKDIIENVFINKKRIQIENIELHQESDILYFNLKVFSIANNRIVMFFEDISERRKTEELERKIEITKQSAALKQQFLANMSHEIRTPMTGIMGMLSLLMRTNLDDLQSEFVKSIRISSENLLNIINDVLDLSKIEAGKMELKPTQVSLQKLCSHFKDLYSSEAKVKSIDFICNVCSSLPENILVDETRLRQIINNLLSNAFKFTDEGSVAIAFKPLEKFDDYLTIQCEVADTGVGITKKNQNKIFNKYTQLESSYTIPFEGTGLGLAICKELTRLMGGNIQVNSKLGEGSVFSFTFKAGYDRTTITKEKISENSYPPKLKLNVLLVEDRALNRKVARLMLENAGCSVDEATNGEEAISVFKQDIYDIILMDIQMPVMDGITAMQNLKKLYSKIPPIIGISANAMEGDHERFISMGMNDYIAKPFKFEALYELLVKWGRN